MRQPGIRVGLGSIVLLASAVLALAQAPPPAPVTFWNKLGIPQGFQKLRDNNTNRRGNNPQRERKPKLKRIADPANLESKNPAIKTAAEIKTEEDLAPQKIKAIKYLAIIGCGCYNKDGEMTKALLAAMDDCTETVRLAAVEAISDAGECEVCANCKQRTCCTQDIAKKLEKMAYDQDDKGCWLEPSERVREAAADALNVCSVRAEPKPEPIPPGPKPEIPVEEGPRPEIPSDIPNDVPPPPVPDASKRRSPDLALKPKTKVKAPKPIVITEAESKATRPNAVKSSASTARTSVVAQRHDPLPRINSEPELVAPGLSQPAFVAPEPLPNRAARPIQSPAGAKRGAATKATPTSARKPSAPAEPGIWISDGEPSAIQMNFRVPLAQSKVAQSKVAQSKVAQSKVAQSKVAQSKVAQSKVAESKVDDAPPSAVKRMPTKPSENLSAKPPVKPATKFTAKAVAKPAGVVASDGDGRARPPAAMAMARSERANSKAATPEAAIAHVDRNTGTVRIRVDGQAIVPTGTRLIVTRDYLLGSTVLGQLEVTESSPGVAEARPVDDWPAAKISTEDTIEISRNRSRKHGVAEK